jgi:hypothetical protein
MADNKVALSRDTRSEFFAEDDPLAELARIVGFDQRPAAVTPPAQERREPAFNLEDELLQEFELYDAPRPEPADPVLAPEARYAPEPVAVPVREPEPYHAPHAADPVHVEPEYEAWAPQAPVYEEPVYTDQAARYVEPAAAEQPVYQPPAPVDGHWNDVDALLDWPMDDRAAEAATPVPAAEPQSYDLADELESAIAEAPAPVAPPVVPVFDRSQQLSRIKLPLANFNAPRPVVHVEPPVIEEPPQALEAVSPPVADLGFAAEHDRHEPVAFEPMAEFEAPSEPEFDIPSFEPVVQTPVFTQPAEITTPKGADFSQLDELIYDVAHFPMQPREAAMPAVPQPVVAEPVAAVAPSVPAPMRSYATPLARAPEPVAAPVVAPVVTPEPAVDFDLDDPFSDHDFELALDDLELDLSEISEEPSRSWQAAAPEVPAPVEAPQSAHIDPPRAAAPVAAPISYSVPESDPIRVMPEDDDFANDTGDNLAFDPAMITDSEDHPETIAELDVPTLTVPEPEQAPTYRPDYDIDIDAELATLFDTSHTGGLDRQPKAAAVAATATAAAAQTWNATAHAAPAAAKPGIADDFDEFERALEEDFRNTLKQPVQAESDAARMRLGRDEMLSMEEEDERPSSRRWLYAAAAAGVVLLGAGGLYAFMSGSVSQLASGDGPVIIAADKTPVKVVPDDKGGKTVPNQDKAVYDRVAGAAPQDPKQQSLISSSEEPVDVVQKTLLPDTLPLEGENDGADDMEVASTPVGETQDPRLLPQQTQAQTPANNSSTPAAGSPRKVRTMIVKADGSLVAQEVDAPAAPTQTAAVMPGGVKPSTQVQTSAIPSTPSESASNALTPATNGTADDMSKVDVVKTTAPSQGDVPAQADKAPIPTARPTAPPKPATAQSTPAAAPAAPAATRPVQVASAPVAPAATPAKPAAAGATGGFVMQVASLPSESEAQRMFKGLQQKFGSVLSGRSPDIKMAEIPGKGTMYRLRVSAGTRADAIALCERYRAAGGSCLVAAQ